MALPITQNEAFFIALAKVLATALAVALVIALIIVLLGKGDVVSTVQSTAWNPTAERLH